MKKVALFVAVTFVSAVTFDHAIAQTKSEKCAAYAREAAGQTPTTTGAGRGAARGAVAGAVVGGNAGRGAAAGAAVGATRRAAQKGRSYQSYYNECMSR